MKKMLLVGLALIALGLTACSSEEPSTPAPLETVPAEFAGQMNPYGAEAASQGGEIYQSYCASCHGETGLGDASSGAPRPNTAPCP